MKEIRKFAIGGGRSNSLLPRFLIVSLIVISSLCSLFVSCDDTLKLQSIKVTTKPTAEYQYLGESLDKTGMVVTGYYNKGYESVISDYTVSPVKFETLGINTVTVSYQGMTDSFEVNVIANTLESISIKNPPNKIAYEEGDKLNLTGLVVEANYKDGTVETITGYTTSPKEGATLTIADKKVVISYQSKTTEQSIVVVETPTPTYKITYNGNGNTSGVAPATQTGVAGGDIVLAINTGSLAKTNCVFVGWNTKANGSGMSYLAGAVIENGFSKDITLYAEWKGLSELNLVGGRIYYIDGNDNGATYRFFDENGAEVTTITVEGLADACYYTVEGKADEAADKFYVADSANCVKKYDNTNYCMWSIAAEDLNSDDMEVLSDGNASMIGAGKKNTRWIFEYRGNCVTYFPNGTIESSTSGGYCYSCWDFCKYCNEYNNGKGINGCNDWFVPSIADCGALYKSGIWGTGSTWVDTTKYVSDASCSFLWSSSANPVSYNSWLLCVDSSFSMQNYHNRAIEFKNVFLAVVRAF